MAIQALPSYVQLLLEGYSEAIVPPLLRSEFDDGYVRQDAQISRRRIERSSTLRICSVEDLQAFKCWLRDDLRNGALWFTYYDPVEQRTLRARFVSGEMRFVPRARVLADTTNIWTATCAIESWY